jgi:DNA-directed RNA polymerase subunit RPC12/RpoP
MSSQYDNEMVRMGIIHFKSGEFPAARRYFERALQIADDNDTRFKANLYLSRLLDDPAEKRRHLESALAIEPTHGEARRELAILDGKIQPDEIIDPNALGPQSADQRAVSADRFTCFNCGGRMVFDADGRTLICEYCARNQSMSAGVVEEEQDFIVAMATGKGHRKPVAMQTFHCQGCGADFLLPPTAKSATCSYCASTHVIQGDSRELVEPDVLIPMALNQREAIRRLVEWVQKNKIEPQGKVQLPRGVYLPVWTFDIVGNVPWKGMFYRNKRYHPVSGIHPVLLNDISMPAVRRMSGLMTRLLPEFNLTNAPAYDPRYLAGWPAEVYERTLSEASLDARQQAVQRIRRQIELGQSGVTDLGYDTTGISILSFKLVFVPAWTTSYAIEGQRYDVIINGASGEVHGETPERGILDWIGNLFR